MYLNIDALNLLEEIITINTPRGVYSPNKELIQQIQNRDMDPKKLKRTIRRSIDNLAPIENDYRVRGGPTEHLLHLRKKIPSSSVFERDWFTKKPIITSPYATIYDEEKKPIRPTFIGDNKSPLSITELPNNYKLATFNLPKFQSGLLINDKNYGDLPCINCTPLREKKFDFNKLEKQARQENRSIFYGKNFDEDKHSKLLTPIMDALERARQKNDPKTMVGKGLENTMRWFEKNFKIK